MADDKYPILQMTDIIFPQEEVGDQIKKNGDTSESSGHQSKGLSFWIASVFIVGQMAGSGVLALPAAMRDAGWSGIPLLLFSCLNSLYAGICLGRCWSILEERYEEYKGKCRYPYPAIAYRAFGKKTQLFVSFCIDVNLFGVAIVFLLLSSQLIASVAHQSGVSFCYWVLILAVFLCPLMWLGTPDDFWPAAVIALGTTIIACILLIVLIARDGASSLHPNHPSPDPTKFFLAFGTIYFSFGGAASFPTFQNDMKNRQDFAKAASMGFVLLILLYLPVAILGYIIYGDKVQDDVIDSISPSTVKSIIQVLLALHMLFAFLLVINATSQEFEEFFKVPNKFGWKRVIIRSCMLVFILFMAQSIPKFGKVLSLVGGSAITLTASVFPCIFYYRLCSLRQPDWPERFIPLHEKIYLIVIIVYGILGGCMSTYAAIEGIAAPDSFVPPCYANSTAANAM